MPSSSAVARSAGPGRETLRPTLRTGRLAWHCDLEVAGRDLLLAHKGRTCGMLGAYGGGFLVGPAAVCGGVGDLDGHHGGPLVAGRRIGRQRGTEVMGMGA